MVYSVQARTNMITNQLEPSGVTETRLLEAISSIERETFLPENLRGVAYLDEDIPLGSGRYLLEPRVFARLLQAAQIKQSDKVLDVACATGYSSAVIAQLTSSVVALESVGELAEIARRNLRAVKGDINLYCASLSGGYSLKAPYDVIFINGAVEGDLAELQEQLAEGGRLIAVKVENLDSFKGGSIMGQATRWTKISGQIISQVLFEAAIPVLSDFRAKPAFKF